MNQPSLNALRSLLLAQNLPVDDLSDLNLDECFCLGESEQPVAVIGLQRFGNLGLLRSLAVANSAKGKGLGKQMVVHLEDYCAGQGIESLYLLTTTAERFFERMNYTVVDRKFVPQAIQASAEFSSICPDDAVVMQKALS